MLLTVTFAFDYNQAVFEQLGFTCSAGIAQSKKFAKVVAGMNKPNGQTILPPSYMPELLTTMPYKNVHVSHLIFFGLVAVLLVVHQRLLCVCVRACVFFLCVYVCWLLVVGVVLMLIRDSVVNWARRWTAWV